MKKKIGFLFIDKTYAVYHAIAIAICLSQSDRYEVVLLCTPRNAGLARQILEQRNNQTVVIKILRPFWHFTIPHYLEIKLQLRTMLFHRYKKLLSSFDAIVSTLYNDLELKEVLKESDVPDLFFANHGVSNRAYSFDDKVKGFDLIFIVGQQELEIRAQAGHLQAGNHALIGYPKFELVKDWPTQRFFPNDNKTILYNPHWEPELTSYFQFGIPILEWFARNENYNLIFAPHSLLFERNRRIWFDAQKYNGCPNIRIDWGSEASNDMSYTKAADLFLGDVSSQALEFLFIKARPCLYIDAHRISHDPDHEVISWQTGHVITSMDHFSEELDNAFRSHQESYREIQEKLTKNMFFQGGETPSSKATAAIQRYYEEKVL